MCRWSASVSPAWGKNTGSGVQLQQSGLKTWLDQIEGLSLEFEPDNAEQVQRLPGRIGIP
jgi:hypothetical protein